jgi:UDP-N-acetylglucosamine 2-epimerase (non-hydrolysing)
MSDILEERIKNSMKILLCFGTRPEAIKMAPLYHEFKAKKIEIKVCVTAQHREMLDQVLDFFEIVPDYDLNLMQANQTLNKLSANILSEMDLVLQREKPDCVVVHGDTTTSSMTAIAAFHLGIKIAHVEAGLRTFNKYAPFPEEINRQITAKIADYHFTPTQETTLNLLNEGIQKKAIMQTGNTVVDALLWTQNKLMNGYENKLIQELKVKLNSSKKLILVTGHRRESFGEGFQNICEALVVLSKREDVEILYPVHLNPNVQEPVKRLLSGFENIHLIEPVDYPTFVWLMQRSFLIISDSGGVQEEAPTLGKPVLVTRNVTERKEGIEKAFSKLVGTNKEKIIQESNDLLDNFKGFKSKENPYGNGNASQIIVEFLSKKN